MRLPLSLVLLTAAAVYAHFQSGIFLTNLKSELDCVGKMILDCNCKCVSVGNQEEIFSHLKSVPILKWQSLRIH